MGLGEMGLGELGLGEMGGHQGDNGNLTPNSAYRFV